MIIVLMGVSGTGKTTIGTLLAEALGWPFYEGDDFHPQANIAKLTQGIPLTDQDREPWLQRLRDLIDGLIGSGTSAVLACSALKESYRQILRGQHEEVQFVYLRGSYQVIKERLAQRQGHFMSADLLASQFETLEEPKGVLAVDVALSPDAIVQTIRHAFGL